MADGEFITVKDAARRLSVTATSIRRMIRTGRLPACDVSVGLCRATWRILASDLGRIGNRIGKAGGEDARS